MGEFYIGQIILTAWSASRDYSNLGLLPCDGRLLNIGQFQALFALIGNTYGGDGKSTFALPDLRSRVPVGVGQGLNLPPVTVGQQMGANQATGCVPIAISGSNVPISVQVPLPSQPPAHSHTLSGVTVQSQIKVGTSVGSLTAPANDNYLVVSPPGGSSAAAIYQMAAPTSTTTLNAACVTSTVAGATDPTGTSTSSVTATGNVVVPPSTAYLGSQSKPAGQIAGLNVTNPGLGMTYYIVFQGIFPTPN